MNNHQLQDTRTSVRGIAEPSERMPPHAFEAEEAVLGSILIDPSAFERIKRILHPLDFYIIKHQWTYEAMLTLREQQQPVDFVTLCKELEACGHMKEIGGPAFVSFLINVVPTAIHAEGYARIVKRMSLRRGMLDKASELAQAAYDETVDEFVELQSSIDDLRGLKHAAIARLSHESILMSSDAVLAGEWPEPVWIVPGLLPAGLGFLHGKPKRGKSWLAMQLACAKASGGRVLDQKIDKGPVLYIALEDNLRRLKSRQRLQQWPSGLSVDFILAEQFSQEFGNLAEGGSDRIEHLVNQRGYELVVIDTFNRAIGQYLKASESNDAGVITKALDGLQRFAVDKNVCTLFIDHQAKSSRNDSGDAIEDVFGSIAKSGVSDFMLGLYRETRSNSATLNVTGRDIEEQSLLLNWDKELGCWQYEGAGSGVRLTQRRQEVIDALTILKRALVQTIADQVRQPKGNTHDRLQQLVKDGLVKREEVGSNVWYSLVEETADGQL